MGFGYERGDGGMDFVGRTLADNGDFDQLLCGVQKNDTKRFAIEKAHVGTEVCDR
jgi:hypothetical protein